jgi:hypothetical protein
MAMYAVLTNFLGVQHRVARHTGMPCHDVSQKIRVENGTERPVVQHFFLDAVEEFHFRPKNFHVTPKVQKLN